MAFANVSYTANGINQTFVVSFGYLQQSHIKVFLDDVETILYTFSPSGDITMDTIPADGIVVRIERDSDITQKLVSFADGSNLTEEDLNDDASQGIFLQQETRDQIEIIEAINTALISGQDQTGVDIDAIVDAALSTNQSLLDLEDILDDLTVGAGVSAAVQLELDLKSNVVDLYNVDNTSDADKPISTATQTALDLKSDGGALDHSTLTSIGTNTHTQIDNHIGSTTNPHSVTKAQVGLNWVDNTSDPYKPVSTATQTALDGKADSVHTHVASDITDFAAQVAIDESDTTISKVGNILRYVGEDGINQDIDLSIYLDDTNLARIESGTINPSTGIATFTRDDLSTFTIDLSSLIDFETITTLVESPVGIFTYTSEDTTQTVIDISNLSVNGHSHVASDITDFDAEVSNNTSVVNNTAKVSNVTHTGEITGSGALTLNPISVSNKTLKAVPVGTDEVLINDSGTLKKITVQSLLDLPSVSHAARGIIQAERTTALVLTTTPVDFSFDTTSIQKDITILEHDAVDRDRLFIKRNSHTHATVNLEITNSTNQDHTVTLTLKANDTTDLSSIVFVVTKNATEMVSRSLILPPIGTASFVTIRVSASAAGLTIDTGSRLLAHNMD